MPSNSVLRCLPSSGRCGGGRFTVLYRSRPAFQILPVDAPPETAGDLASDPLYHAQPLGRSTDGRSAADHDSLLYRK